MNIFLSDFYCLLRKEPLILILLIWVVSGLFAATFSFYISLVLLPVLFYKGYLYNLFDLLFFLICGYSCLYALFTGLNGYYDVALGNYVFHSVYPPIFYLIGKYFTKFYSDFILLLFLLIVELMAVSVLIDVILDINEHQFINQARQIKLEDGTSTISATLLGLKVSLSVCASGVIFSSYINQKEKKYKFLFSFCSILSLLCVIHLINRTGLILAVISLSIVLILNIKYLPKVKFILLSVCLIFIGFISFPILEVGDKIEEAYASRELDSSYDISSAGGRTKLWKEGIEGIVEYPFGRDSKEKVFYAHNFWLDTVATSGILPFIFLLIVTIKHIINSLFLFKYLHEGLLYSLIVCCNIGYFLTCMVEPVMQGVPVYVFSLFLFIGICKQVRINARW